MQFLKDKKIYIYTVPIVTVLLVIVALYYSKAAAENNNNGNFFQEQFGTVMGTSGCVTILPDSSLKKKPSEIFTEAYARIKYAEALLSRYIPESDISRINSAKAGEKIKVDPLTWRALVEAKRFYILSNGAFDPAVGSIINIYPWKEKNIPALPAQSIINQALQNSGFDKIKFFREGMYISKTNSDVILDLGGIAKGLGVSIFAETLKEEGVKTASIEIGGEVTLIGEPETKSKTQTIIGANEKIWTTGIRNPRSNSIIKNLKTKGNISIATSGDYEKYFMVKDKRYSHIIDPHTGYPTSGGIISATVVTKRSCTIADALATAITVLGVDKSRELLKLFPDTDAYLVLDDMSEIIIEGGLADTNNIKVEFEND